MSQVVALHAATDGRSIALGDAIREFLASDDLRPSTKAVYERTLEALLDDLGADVPLSGLSRGRLEAHLRDRYGQCASDLSDAGGVEAVSRDGTRIRYSVLGSGGPAVVFIHCSKGR